MGELREILDWSVWTVVLSKFTKPINYMSNTTYCQPASPSLQTYILKIDYVTRPEERIRMWERAREGMAKKKATKNTAGHKWWTKGQDVQNYQRLQYILDLMAIPRCKNTVAHTRHFVQWLPWTYL